MDSAPWFPLTRSTCKPSRQPPVFAAVNFQPEIVPAEEPVEGALRLFVPPGIGCGAVGFEAGRDHRLRLDGLLVEVRARAAATIKSVAADGPQLPMLRSLDFHEPAQCLQASFKHALLAGGAPAENQGVGELGVVVSQLLFKPRPIRAAATLSKIASAAR